MRNTSASNRRLLSPLFIGASSRASSRASIVGARAAAALGLGRAMNDFTTLAADGVVATLHVVDGGSGDVASARMVASEAGVGFIPGDAVGEAIIDCGARRGWVAKPSWCPDSSCGS